MKTIKVNSITDIKKGVIIHQVNCLNAIGSGISGAIIKEYPIVAKEYHKSFINKTDSEVFGTWRAINVTEDLTIINMYSQRTYGNAYINNCRYTNYDAMDKCLSEISQKYKNKIIYVPENIGCGLAGGDWSIVQQLIAKYPNIVVAKR